MRRPREHPSLDCGFLVEIKDDVALEVNRIAGVGSGGKADGAVTTAGFAASMALLIPGCIDGHVTALRAVVTDVEDDLSTGSGHGCGLGVALHRGTDCDGCGSGYTPGCQLQELSAEYAHSCIFVMNLVGDVTGGSGLR